MQVSSEKRSSEIELTESLKRRRDDLRGRLDDLEGDAGAGVLQEGKIELRQTELESLIRSIDNLQDQIEGMSPSVVRLLDY